MGCLKKKKRREPILKTSKGINNRFICCFTANISNFFNKSIIQNIGNVSRGAISPAFGYYHRWCVAV